MTEFLKKAMETGRIKSLEEAFEEYPVEEEYHKGKIENVLKVKEESSEYYKYTTGDIVFVARYKYSNGNMGSNHLFVIIEEDNIAVPIEYFGMLISSNLDKLKYTYNEYLEKDGKNNLHKDSIVKTDYLYKISEKDILFKIGEVDKDKIKVYKDKYLSL